MYEYSITMSKLHIGMHCTDCIPVSPGDNGELHNTMPMPCELFKRWDPGSRIYTFGLFPTH